MDPVSVAYVSGSLVAVIGALVSWAKWVHPKIKRARSVTNGVIETLVGRDPIIDDATGKEIVPAQPGLGVRMAAVEEAVIALSRHDARLSAVEHRQDRQDEELRLHGAQIEALKNSQLERIATKAESAQMWRAVAEKDPEITNPGFDDADVDD